MSPSRSAIAMLLSLAAAALAVSLLAGPASATTPASWARANLGGFLLLAAMAVFAWAAPAWKAPGSRPQSPAATRPSVAKASIAPANAAATPSVTPITVPFPATLLNWQRVAGVVVGIALAIASQAALSGKLALPTSPSGLPWVGGMGLLLGGLIFGLAVLRPAEPEPAILPPSAFQPRFPRLLWAGGAIYLVGLVLYLLLGNCSAMPQPTGESTNMDEYRR